MPKDIYTEDEWDVIPESIDQDRVKPSIKPPKRHTSRKQFIDEIDLDNCDEEDAHLIIDKVRSELHKKSSTSMKDYFIVGLIAVIFVMGFNNYTAARVGRSSSYGYSTSGSAGGGGGGCCGGGAGGASLSTEQLSQQGLEFYVAKYNDTDVEAQVQDFGCHQEIHIYKNGQLVARISYRGGEFAEL